MANENIKENGQVANELHKILVDGNTFGFPDLDFSKPPFNWQPDEDSVLNKDPIMLTNEDLTERKFTGKGTFDALMEAVYNHLNEEYEKGRFTKDDYVKAYIALTEASMTNAVNFLTQRDQGFWQAILSQVQARTGLIQLEIAKVELIGKRYSAYLEEAKYAQSKMQTLNLESAYDISEYNLNKMLPMQFQLVTEQMESQRAQTMDVRTDSAVVKGSIGKQKDLYTQQIESYKRDAEYKFIKLHADAFITMKTIDEGLLPPTQFQNAQIDSIIKTGKDKLGL